VVSVAEVDAELHKTAVSLAALEVSPLSHHKWCGCPPCGNVEERKRAAAELRWAIDKLLDMRSEAMRLVGAR
jgi:hypothetical protein